MIGLLQRVRHASVEIQGKTVASIGRGLLVFVGIERGDTETQADRLLQRVLAYRVFPDEAGRMNLDLRETGGGLLLVPQFTLPADTRRGNRPSFTPAASPQLGSRLFAYLLHQAGEAHTDTHSGIFAADMQVALVNDGPVTFWLRAEPLE
ncbi:MAG: D-tyrosyl-tRNA(Tyr) deacylase [Gammaproteobacteria bacterium]|nr:D-tyrosyl-tRNA(Tyr) deacylase [Gammaproteobacteria bacterium]MDE2345006.1 D-tyrosyl-tRNA(Tyr) deacylase [Gammaproteobacteria bacterium]